MDEVVSVLYCFVFLKDTCKMAGKFSLICISMLFLSTFTVTGGTTVKSDSITDFIKNLVHTVQKALNTIADLVTKIDDGINNNYDEFQKQMVDLTRQTLLEFVHRFRDSFDKIAERCNPNGQKMAECIINSQPAIIETAVTLFDETSKCISEDLIVVAEDLSPMVKELVAAQERADATANNIDDCGDDDITCTLYVAVDLLKILLELPEIITNGIEPAREDLDTLFATVKNCVNVVSTRQNFYNNFAKVLDDLATCAA